MASRPDDAINFSQAGGSSRLERAGVWWCSMPYNERIKYQSFVENQALLEKRWHKHWGDRMNELVFIGQDIQKEKMISDLESCLLQENEQYLFDTKVRLADPFPKDI